MEVTMVKLCTWMGVLGSFIAGFFGGWTTSMETLCILMLIDYITGIILSLVFHKSNKTEDGAFESNQGAKGLVRKFMVIVAVFVAHRIDIEIGANYLRDGVCTAFLVNEALSIIENLGMMGLPIPEVLTQGISVLKNRDSKKDVVKET